MIPAGRVAALLVLAACGRAEGTAPAGQAPAFQLVCDATETRESAALHCVRHDTRNGDTKRVALASIPAAQGPTATTPGPPGSYQLVCRSTTTEARSDFYCVRLDTRTGELLLVALPKVGVIPEGAPAPPPEPPHAYP